MYQARHPELANYLEVYGKAKAQIQGVMVTSIPWADDAEEDMLAKATVTSKALSPRLMYKVAMYSAMQANQAPLADVSHIITTPGWHMPLIEVLNGRDPTANSEDLRWLQHKTRAYALIEGALYKAGMCMPLL
ncbi:hypothetical protein E2562_017333 [Oryza meyeriana var. granulata]|uniref:Uncharacterized protein n=1 Tax=Oryza meyeriana var. granulata TaxID=110450 RepID=A0A6G1BY80_9ORYZ|nr:hypothetical protein E2562_017333 [Oryza meyeriana var. granulata]